MKKIIFWIVGILLSIVVLGGLGFYFYIKSLLPANEEKISNNNEKIIENIDKQLQGIDINSIKNKSNLIEQKSIKEIQKLIEDKKITRKELVAYYLINIKEKDQSEDGNNSVSEINSNAIKEAEKFDEIKNDETLLKGIPVLVKENINTNDMPTSAGSFALKDFIPNSNADVVNELKENGAIILGKTNLSEMSNWMSRKNPSGYSAKKGQTTNPFNPLKISPSGSSSGSAVAMAIDLATTTLGTETIGSIVSPSSVNSVVGYKPTRNKISGEGVIPITYSLDTVGTISKNVEDAYLTYNASTKNKISLDFEENYIKGKKFGILKSQDKNFDSKLKETLTNLGAEVLYIDVDKTKIDSIFILKNDFEKDLNEYLTKYNAPIKSLQELIDFNKKDEKIRMRYGQSYLEESLNFKERNDEKVKDIINIAKENLNKVIDENKLDAIVFKDNTGATLSAVAGAPEISVPFGMIKDTPTGATFSTKENEDKKLLKIAYSFEKLTNLRKLPNKKDK